jgi:UDP-glucose:(heptosyl)LPS alpha-1,3-glucosyltransferase
VLAHPARVDVTAAVILEALINGLPVVATAECGFAHHIEEADAGKIVPPPFDGATFARLLAEVCGPRNATFSANGIAYGEAPELYSGLTLACDLIEADAWPIEITAAAEDQA